MATLELQDLRKSFGNTAVLHGIDLALRSGEMLVIVGASGCGKSTLLRLVAGLETPTAGRIVLDGRDVAGLDPAARDIAMVFQNYALYPHMTVFDNMAYALRIRGQSADEIKRRVRGRRGPARAHAAAAAQAAAALRRAAPARRDGTGDRARAQAVPVRRAAVQSRCQAARQMRAEIRRLQRRMGVTSLYVTHDQVEAMTLGDRLLVLHQGRPVQLATPMQVFERPADIYVAGFIGAPSMNFLPAVLSHDGSAARLDLGTVIPFADGPRAGPDGRKLAIGIRPEHVLQEPGGLAFEVDLLEPLGSETVVIGRLPDQSVFSVKLAGGGPVGDSLAVAIPATAIHVFDAGTGLRLEPGR